MKTVSRDEWLTARKALLVEEKALTRQRDALSAKRRALPWVRIDKPYSFATERGPATLSDLFGPHSQLIVYHFMYGPDWAEGCPSCSFWADNFEGIDIHLAHRDTRLIAVAKAPLETLTTYRKRMGWSFDFVSAHETDFNEDFDVSFSAEQVEAKDGTYNYRPGNLFGQEAAGVSVFARRNGEVYHTYSTYSRGLDMLNGAYHYLDLTPKGRDEDGLPFTMSWLRRRDQYEGSDNGS